MMTVRRTLTTLLIALFALNTAIAQDGKSVAPPSTSLTITAAAGERVRFTAPSTVVRIHIEVYSAAGESLFDGSSKGNVFDWTLADSTGQRVADGLYLCVVTAKTLSGKIGQRIGSVLVQGKQVSVRGAQAAQLSAAQQQAVGPVEENASLTVLREAETPSTTVIAHDGQNGQVTSTRGALTFRTGDVFSGKEQEQMRLTEEGNLGIGTEQPEARLDVNGMIRARQGFQFSDGSVLDVSPTGGGLRVTLPGGKSVGVNFAPNAVTGTANRIPKFDTNGTSLVDSTLYQDANTGYIGWGTTTPAHPFTVRRNGGTLGVHSFGELYVDRDDRTRSASMILGTGGTLKWIFGMPYQDDGFQVFDLLAAPAPGVSRFYVHPTSGNIGIGTNTPANKLSVQTATGNYGLTHTDGVITVGSYVGGSGSGVSGGWFGTLTASPLHFFTGGGQPRITITPTGNVGVGNFSPSFKFDVLGNLRSNSSASNDIVVQTTGGTNAWARYQIQTTNQNWVLGSSQNFNGDQLYLTDATHNTMRMMVQPNNGPIAFPTGNVGIGTTTPTAKLDVISTGGVSVSGTSTSAIGVSGTTSSATGLGVYARNLSGGYAIQAEGNAAQSRDKGGFVKAMVYVLENGTISRCYNSLLAGSAASTAPCGFTSSRFCDSFQSACYTTIDFGFKVDDRFWSATIESGGAPHKNRGINAEAADTNSIGVRTFKTGEEISSDFFNPFMLIVY